MLRRIGLSISLLVTMVIAVPLVSSTAHNLRANFASRSRRHRRHSRAWWRRHRAMMRRRQAMIARRRALIAATKSENAGMNQTNTLENHVVLPTLPALPSDLYRDGKLALQLPSDWTPAATLNGASTFRITAPNGMPEAHATLAVVAPARNSEAIGREQRNTVGGASFTELRRGVIDKMFTAGGWVVNDRQREIGGRRVFEVIAQTPSSTGKPEQVWNFYFTEVNGRVYALTTQSSSVVTEKLASDAERFLGAFSVTEGNKSNGVKSSPIAIR